MNQTQTIGRRRWRRAAPLLVVVTIAGCIGPRQFPAAPLSTMKHPDGGYERAYDTNSDGRADSVEVLNKFGRVTSVRYDRDHDGAYEIQHDWTASGTNPRPDAQRQLLIILDSIPFDLVQEVHRQGHFAYFHRPTRVLAPFPVMTDPSLAEFFGIAPVPGVEAAYFDGQRLTDSSDTYMAAGNAPWMECASFHLPLIDHAWSYLYPNMMYDYGLARLQDEYEDSEDSDFIGYMVGTSAVGSKHGREGHLAALRRLDRLCQQFIADAGGELQITLMSDHGHTCRQGRRLSLGPHLAAGGFRVALAVNDANDVIVPEWGLVSCAALYCKPDTTPRLAAHAVKSKGVEHAAYRATSGDVIVLSKSGSARVVREQDRLAYMAESGDPLNLAPTIETLRREGRLDARGFAAAGDWFDATVDHPFPDAPARLHRAFNGLFKNVPQVLLSLEDGVYHGSGSLALILRMAAVHGSLRPESSYGFAMSTIADLPASVPMQSLRASMNAAGIRARCMKEEKSER